MDNSTLADARDIKGDKLTEEAEEKLNSFCSCLFGLKRYEEAADLYCNFYSLLSFRFIKAASSYKVASSWANAAVSFERAANIFDNELKEDYSSKQSAIDNFLEAGRCYRKFRPDSLCPISNFFIIFRGS